MKEVLLRGGDTDTNASIVCAMVGAALGEDAVPTHWRERVLSFNVERDGGLARPEFLLPEHQFEKLIGVLIDYAPTSSQELVIKGIQE